MYLLIVVGVVFAISLCILVWSAFTQLRLEQLYGENDPRVAHRYMLYLTALICTVATAAFLAGFGVCFIILAINGHI
jgi:hypothetical protein